MIWRAVLDHEDPIHGVHAIHVAVVAFGEPVTWLGAPTFPEHWAEAGPYGWGFRILQAWGAAERARREDVESERDRLRAVLAIDGPWPVADVLCRLADDVDHLLLHHSCDHDDHELAAVRDAARVIVARLTAGGVPCGKSS